MTPPTSGHTPGPWKYAYEGSGDFVVFSAEHGEIGTAWSQHAHFLGHGAAAQQNEANAKLIAEAPAMLALLRARPEPDPDERPYDFTLRFNEWDERVRALLQRIDGAA